MARPPSAVVLLRRTGCAIPARVVAGGANARATLAIGARTPAVRVAPLHAARASHVSEYLLTSDLQPAFQPLFWVCEFRLSPSRFWLPPSAFFLLPSAFPLSRPPELRGLWCPVGGVLRARRLPPHVGRNCGFRIPRPRSAVDGFRNAPLADLACCWQAFSPLF
jgi:hypothetical protein